MAHTDCVVRVCGGLLFSAYDVYWLWYLLPDLIFFAIELGMAIEVAMCSRVNVLEVLELLYNI